MQRFYDFTMNEQHTSRHLNAWWLSMSRWQIREPGDWEWMYPLDLTKCGGNRGQVVGWWFLEE